MHSIKEELLKRKNGNDEIEDEKVMTWKVKVKEKKKLWEVVFILRQEGKT